MENEINSLFVYDGSRILEPLTGIIGLPIDQVNFLVCQLLALGLGFMYRTYLCPTKVSPVARHVFQIIVGFSLTYFCFGSQVLHLFIQTAICYLLINTLRPGVMEKAVFATAMIYLSVCHIYRVVYDYGGYTLDITGPLMVNTQKLACLAYSLKDGSVKDDSKLSPTMKYHASKKWPGLLEFGSYVFCFSGAMCGPFCFYKDYISFIEGSNYKSDKDDDDKNKKPPSPMPTVVRLLIWTVISGAIMMVIIPRIPVSFMKEEAFYELSLFYKTLYMMASTCMMRFKYYFAWKLGEAVNVNSGLGYVRQDAQGQERWDLLNNADIVKVETATSLKVLLDNWNKTTTYWLRYVVYERVPNTIAVFTISAFWHGFYAGYYVTFLSGAIFINCSRIVRRKFRPYFQMSSSMALLYDILTFLATQVSIAYLVYPFVMLEIRPTIVTYWHMYFWYHILVALAFVIVPLIPTPGGSRRSEKKAQ